MEERFKQLYARVRPIVLKLKGHYYLQLWDSGDWDQEGMLVLYQLLEEEGSLWQGDGRLYRYFKTKFSNYVHDQLRKQESQKRRFHKLAYEEISTVSHRLRSPGLDSSDYLALTDLLRQYAQQLDAQGQARFQQLLAGERFAGRRQMLRELAPYLSDFRG